MCGILAILGLTHSADHLPHALNLVKRLEHRGPDSTRYKVVSDSSILCHTRLSIIDVENGTQPLQSKDGSLIIVFNGEIYNYLGLKDTLLSDYDFRTDSDTELILALYTTYGLSLFDYIEGMYSFVMYDCNEDISIIARDPLGIIPLYYGEKKSDNTLWIASEMKCINDSCDMIKTFPPGHYMDSKSRTLVCFNQEKWYKEYLNEFKGFKELKEKEDDDVMFKEIHDRLLGSVTISLSGHKNVKFGIFLSGGLDSSLVVSIAVRYLTESQGYSPQDICSYSVGIEGSPDIIAAKRVADFLGIKNKVLTFTPEEGINAIKDVVYYLETYDVTTIRSSVPMRLLARVIAQDGNKFVLSGEGADELFGGYLYFHDAPDTVSFAKEITEKVLNLHLSDCLRTNKTCASLSLEARVPLLNRSFVNYVMENVHPAKKMVNQPPYFYNIEKYVLRKAFDYKEKPYLPDDILWRQKEQFSDGVGYNWIDSLKEYTQKNVSDEDFKNAVLKYPINTPKTKEAYYYREIFAKLFPQPSCEDTVYVWTPKLEWGCDYDPSGRAQKAHSQSDRNITQKILKQ